MKLFKDWIKNLAKRGFAAVLAASLVVTCYPESAIISYADPDTSEEGTTLDETTESSIGEGWTDTSDGLSSGTYDVVATSSDADEPVYKITKNSTPQTFKAFNNMETWMNRSYVSAPENTYSLTVATGATDGSKVLYFSINYKDTSNISRKQFLFPHVDAFKKSDDLLNYYFNPADSSTANSGTSIYDTYGSKVASQLNYKDVPKEQAALGAFTVQDYAFQTEAEIKTIESIDVYIEVGSWTIQGMSIYKVDRYKGMEEYGLMSGQTFFDFEGRCIADVKKKDENAQLTLPSAGGSTDTVTRIKKDDKSASIYIENHTGGEEFEKKFASDTALYTMRMDFSDVYEGGLETFLNKDAKSMKDYGGIVEDIAWEIQYKDVHGWTRKVTLPVLLSAYGEAMQSLGDDAIMGFAQRGDTIAFQGLLPDFSSVMGKPIIYVGKQATDKMASYGITMDRATSAMTSNSDSLKSDDLRVAGISIYEGGCMAYLNDGTDTDGNTVRGATIQYVFENSDPMLYQTTDQLKGRQIKYDGSESFKLSTYKSGAPLVAAEKGLNQFLVTIKTKDNSKTDASSDLSLKLHYKTSEGQGAYTRNYKAKEASNDYMGLWPDVNGKNYLDNSGLVAGGSV